MKDAAVWIVCILAIGFYFTLLVFGPTSKDVNRVCRHHHGVADVRTGATRPLVIAVCRDGQAEAVR